MPVSLAHLWLALQAIIWRELVKFTRQTERLASALIRPALWLLVFATGLHDVLGVSIIEPYETYTPYQEYILPGLLGIVVLFQCMQAALSMVYDREAGVMRVMLISPLPRVFLLGAKIVAATILAIFQCYAFLLLAALFGISFPGYGSLNVLPGLFLAGVMLGSIGLLVSVYTRQIENFAGMMNFVVFPMFFMSPALYPLWKLREAGADVLFWAAEVNPFTHAVEFIRYLAYGKLNWVSLGVVVASTAVTFFLALRGYTPRASRQQGAAIN